MVSHYISSFAFGNLPILLLCRITFNKSTLRELHKQCLNSFESHILCACRIALTCSRHMCCLLSESHHYPPFTCKDIVQVDGHMYIGSTDVVLVVVVAAALGWPPHRLHLPAETVTVVYDDI